MARKGAEGCRTVRHRDQDLQGLHQPHRHHKGRLPINSDSDSDTDADTDTDFHAHPDSRADTGHHASCGPWWSDSVRGRLHRHVDLGSRDRYRPRGLHRLPGHHPRRAMDRSHRQQLG